MSLQKVRTPTESLRHVAQDKGKNSLKNMIDRNVILYKIRSELKCKNHTRDMKELLIIEKG